MALTHFHEFHGAICNVSGTENNMKIEKGAKDYKENCLVNINFGTELNDKLMKSPNPISFSKELSSKD